MAIQDVLTRFAKDLVCNGGAGPFDSSSIKCGSSGADADHGLTAFNHGFGDIGSKQARIKVVVTEAFDAATTIQAVVRQGSDAAMTADIIEIATGAAHALAAGPDTLGFYLLDIPLPDITDQWCEVRIIRVGSNPTVGKVSAWIQLGVDHGHGVIAVA